MKNYIKLGVILLSIVSAGASMPKYDAEAYEDPLPSVKNEIEVTGLDFELKKHDQVHEKGTKSQLEGLDKTTLEFIKSIGLGAYESAIENDLYASVTIAQAILESGSGQSGLSLPPYNNLFGVKGAYKGKSVNVPTREDDGTGKTYKINAHFAVYPDWETSIQAHDELLKHGLNGFYRGAWKSVAETYKDATSYLQGRYATDTKYASKLNHIIEKYNLTRFDSKFDERDYAWLRSDSLDPWERPIVPPKIVKKITWATAGTAMLPQFKKHVKEVTEIHLEEFPEDFKADVYYVERKLDTTLDFTNVEEIERRTKDPKVGDILVYHLANTNKEIIEKFAVIEALDKDVILISEGIKDEKGIHSVYRVITKDNAINLQYINREEV